MRGLFSDGVDRLGGQAKSILITHLQQTGRFIVVDRDNMRELTNEAAISEQ
jgi:curli biogenesis system outer membrane secretion channel CsgG